MKEDSIKEEDLANLIRSGNSMAFAVAFKQYRELLFKHAYRIVRDMDEAEDVVQEVYTTLWEKRTLIPEDANIANYLYRMTRNRVLNKLSRHKVMDNYIQYAMQQTQTYSQDSEQSLLEKELAHIIEEEINKLPPRMQEIFKLSRREGLSHKEIANLLQITEGTSKLQVSKALVILRRNIMQAILLLMAT